MSALRQEADSLLRELSLWPFFVDIQRNLHNIVDDFRDSTPGYTFASATPYLEAMGIEVCQMFSRLKSESLRKQILKQCYKYQDILCVMYHTTAGGPSRAPEVGNLKYAQPLEGGGMRNIMFSSVRKCVVASFSYTKLAFKTKFEKIILKFLTEAWSPHVVVLVALVKNVMLLLSPNKFDSTFLFTANGKLLDSKHLTKCLRTVSLNTLHFQISVEEWRQLFIAFTHQHVELGASPVETLHPAATFIAKQCGHTLETHLTYATSSRCPIGVDFKTELEFFRASRLCQNMLGMVLGSVKRCEQQAKFDAAVEVEDALDWVSADTTSHITAAIMAFKTSGFPFPFFRTQQMLVATALVIQRTDVLYIAATGSGKSVVYIAPLKHHNKISCLILPFVSLKDDVIIHLNAIVFSSKLKPSDFTTTGSQIVVLALEQIAQAVTFLHHLHTLKLLANIIFDEVHVLFVDAWRPITSNAHNWRAMLPQVPYVFLTATFPSVIREQFQLTFASPEAPIRIVRDTINRPEIEYVIVTHDLIFQTRGKACIQVHNRKIRFQLCNEQADS